MTPTTQAPTTSEAPKNMSEAPKNMLDFAKSITAQATAKQQPSTSVDEGAETEAGTEQPKNMSEAPKNMLDFARMIKAQGATPVEGSQETAGQETASQEAEDPSAWKKDVRAGHFERSSMRAAEALGGMPGEFVQSMAAPLGNYIGKGIEAVTGKKVPESAYGAATQLPTAEDIKNFHEKYTGEYYRAQTSGEQLSDEIVQDAVRIGAPMLATGGVSVLTNLGRISGIVGAGQGAKQVAKALGYGEDVQGYAKLVAETATSFFMPWVGKNLAKKHYAEVNKLPANIKGDSRVLQRSLKDTVDWANSVGDTPDKKFIREILNPVYEYIQKNPEMSYQEALSIKRSINQLSEKLYELPSTARRLARSKLAEVRKSFDPFFKGADKHQAGWFKNMKAGDEIHGAIEGSQQFGEFVKRNAKTLSKAGVSSYLLDSIASTHTFVPGVALGAVGAAGYPMFKLVYQMYRSPLLLQAYTKAGAAAAIGNIPQVASSLRKVDRELSKEEY